MKLTNINVNLLVTLSVLLEERSVTAAAVRLGVSQSAVSVSLKQSRQLFDDPLLIRTRPLMTLTPAARDLRDALKDAIDKLEAVVSSPGAFEPTEFRREIRIGSTDYGVFVFAPALINLVSELAPNVTLRFVPMHDGLRDRSIDFVIGAAPPIDQEIVSSMLFKDRAVCLVRSNHPCLERASTKIDARDLEIYPHLHVAVNRNSGTLVGDLVPELEPSLCHTVSSHIAAPFVALQSDVLLIVSENVAIRCAEVLPLEILELPTAAPAVPVYLSWRRNQNDVPWAIWLREQIFQLGSKFRRNL